jgi:hypothetical protein
MTIAQVYYLQYNKNSRCFIEARNGWSDSLSVLKLDLAISLVG